MSEGFYLTYPQRRRIEKLYKSGMRPADIAKRINRGQCTIYSELKRGYTGKLDENKRPEYSAEIGQTVYQEHLRNRGRYRRKAT